MYIKLALRNVKRQVGNYLIYFLTVTVTVALMFAINNVIYNEQLQRYADSMVEMRGALNGLSVFIALIVAFVLGYASSFMMRLRKREFGTYLTLGMKRGNVLRIFIMETFFLGLASLASGVFLGLFLYQGMMAVMLNLLELEASLAAYSAEGLISTVKLVCLLFAYLAARAVFRDELLVRAADRIR